MSETLSDSAFYIWRTVCAVAHADEVLSEEEVRFIAEAMEDMPFSNDQRMILEDDLVNAKNVDDMYAGITDA
ncbi:MAG: TerB family tellurite resistance protein, partial [Bdellovibrionales bacterium]